MTDDFADYLTVRAPTAARPLLGLTVLLVEDSRFASEAVRLLCLRSGARIRRADSLRAAHRHLATYRPTTVIVDLGLPDGSGLDLIRELTAASPRVPVVLATSGAPEAAEEAIRAGADGFLPKPVESLAVFQQAVLAVLPAEARPQGPRPVNEERIDPDPIALRDDLVHAAFMLEATQGEGAPDVDYLAHFLTGVARISHDGVLIEAAEQLKRDFESGGAWAAGLREIDGLVRDRIAGGAPL